MNTLMPEFKVFYSNHIKGEETEANSGLGDGVHRELLGVSDDLHFKNHQILELGSQRTVMLDTCLSTQPNV